MTSVDIAQGQLDVAARRAEELRLDIAFLRADVTDLGGLADAHFDHVYTGGHVAVWVSDIWRYYAEAARILRRGGLLVVNEYHPFRRIWRPQGDGLAVATPYGERGPFAYHRNDDILRPSPGPLVSYEFHWTIADMINAVLRAGCQLVAVEEYGEHVGDWEGAPTHGLPEFFLIIAVKA